MQCEASFFRLRDLPPGTPPGWALAARPGCGGGGIALTVARIEKGRMEPTVALLTRLVEACGLELRMTVAKPRLPARDPSLLSPEDQLRENESLTALFLIGEQHRAR